MTPERIMSSMSSRVPRVMRAPWFWATLVSAWVYVGHAWAAGGKPASKIVEVVDTRKIPPGFARWLSDVYNTNLWLYGLVVVGIMAGMGVTLGFVFDKAVGMLGINLGKLDHHE